jgi:uracil-DNA glycosylase
MHVTIEKQWQNVLADYFETAEFLELTQKVKTEYQKSTIYPSAANIFRAFNLTPFDKVKVVILGQDPYHTPGVADGLSFSSPEGNKVPPSLQNIYKEIAAELYDGVYPNMKSPDLTRWAEQGVLMINATLTVKSGVANSHKDIGWEGFTNQVIHLVAQKRKSVVFLLWGNFARKKKAIIEKYITSNNHLVLESAHPSPFSANNGFFGNNQFKDTNVFLVKHGYEAIIW